MGRTSAGSCPDAANDLARELVPADDTLVRGVDDAGNALHPEPQHHRGQVRRERRMADLVVDEGDLAAPSRQAQERLRHVGAVRARTPRRSARPSSRDRSRARRRACWRRRPSGDTAGPTPGRGARPCRRTRSRSRRTRGAHPTRRQPSATKRVARAVDPEGQLHLALAASTAVKAAPCTTRSGRQVVIAPSTTSRSVRSCSGRSRPSTSWWGWVLSSASSSVPSCPADPVTRIRIRASPVPHTGEQRFPPLAAVPVERDGLLEAVSERGPRRPTERRHLLRGDRVAAVVAEAVLDVLDPTRRAPSSSRSAR